MKRCVFFILSVLFTSLGYAQKISEEEALLKAQKFLSGKSIIKSTKLKSARRAQQTENEPYYLFNAENNGGFVIISGDERTEEILGYSNSGNIDLDNMPPNLKGWLENYSKQIKALDTSGVKKRSASKRAPKAAISPMLSTRWGQGDPYNMKCPDYFDQGEKCVTGCIATAMAQVMYYHQLKSTNKIKAEIPSYNCKSFTLEYGQITVDAIPNGSIIDWDNMLNSYDGSETIVQKEAVANLMLYCGAAVRMDYGPYYVGSEAYFDDIPVALKQYFDYSEHTELVYRHAYTDDSWDELIYSELSKGNPVCYSGSNGSAGHAFVCDGYDGNGYYHINWGWDGLSDSFFLLSALNPDQQGTGGSSAGFNDGQCALIGAIPNGDTTRLTSQNVYLTGNTSFTLNETDENIIVPVRWKVKNQTDISESFDHAIGLYKKDEFIKVIKETGTSETFTAGQEVTIEASLNIETSLSTGVYQLYALSRNHGDDEWYRNENSSDCYITLVVKAGAMTFYVGKPAVSELVINFADDEVKRICVKNWDTDGDGEISYEEAASVTDFGGVFMYSYIKTFDEAQYFTGITSFGLSCIEGEGCRNLTSIKLPASVTSIREGAFYGCVALKSIDIPASVKNIGKKAFQACFSMQEIVLHEGLENIHDEAFYKCYALSSINIPSSVTLLGDNICYLCDNLNDFYVDTNNPYYCAIDGILFTKDRKTLLFFPVKREGVYNIPEGTEIINSYAFATSKLESVIIPKSVTKMGDNAFDAAQNINDITIPSTVTTIGKWVLSFCTNLKRVVLEGSRQVIPERMFSQCFGLENIELPDNLESIEPYAFKECTNLTEITIPSKVTSIGDYAFFDSGLIKVTSLMQTPCVINSTVFKDINSTPILYVPEESLAAYKQADYWKDFPQILSIGEKAIEQYVEFDNGVLVFYYDTNREDRKGTTYELNNKAFAADTWLDYRDVITKVVFDPSFANARPITTSSWFDSCEKLTEIQGIENVNTSEVVNMEGMFYGCRSLTSVDLSHFDTKKATSMCGMFAECNSLKSIDLSGFNTSEVVDMEGMFDYCSDLKTLILPSDMTFIGPCQFSYCSSLTDISIPASVTSISESAFKYCSSLREITIPSKVISIGDNAFSYSGLKKVTSLMLTPCSIKSTVFENIDSYSILYVPEESLDTYKVADNWKNFSQILPIGETGIEPYIEFYDGILSFYYDTNREKRDGKTYEITSQYSWHENNVTKVIFDTSFANVRPTTTIDWFKGCDKLTEIQGIENLNTSEVTNMSGMFSGCRSLTSVDLSHFDTKKVTSMSAMFWGCSNLKTVILPDDLTFIDSWQFVYCSSLTNISIPASVTFIGDHAFHSCGSLEIITIPSKVTSIGDNAFSYSGLKKVTSLMLTPCSIKSTVFENIDSYSILYVPEESLDAYKAADNWKNFPQILPIGEKAKEPYVEFYNRVLSFYYDTNREKRDGKTYEITDNYSWLENSNDITTVIFDTSFENARPTTTMDWFSGFENLTTIQGIENLNTSEVTDMNSMFSGCRSLTSIDLSNFKTSKVKVIKSMFALFRGCSNLKTVTLPDDMTFIGPCQFEECSSLTDISIPASVTSISESAFQYCSSLREITIPSKVISIGDNAFNGCIGLIVINIGKDVQTIGSKAFANVGTTASARTRSGSDESMLIVNCYAESVPQIASDAFENTPIEMGTLYVVDNLKDAYKSTSPWSRFGKIVGFEESTGINAILNGSSNAMIFDLQGNRLDNVRKGVNIIRTKDGKTKKIIVR